MPKKERQTRQIINISTDLETKNRLNEYAKEKHMSMSQAVTTLVWEAKLKSEMKN